MANQPNGTYRELRRDHLRVHQYHVVAGPHVCTAVHADGPGGVPVVQRFPQAVRLPNVPDTPSLLGGGTADLDDARVATGRCLSLSILLDLRSALEITCLSCSLQHMLEPTGGNKYIEIVYRDTYRNR